MGLFHEHCNLLSLLLYCCSNTVLVSEVLVVNSDHEWLLKYMVMFVDKVFIVCVSRLVDWSMISMMYVANNRINR